MSGNSFGLLYCVSSFGESHGPAYGGVVDGCPPGLELSAADIQRELDRRKPGSSRHVTQRRESDAIEILAGKDLDRVGFAPLRDVPGSSRPVTQRRESDATELLPGADGCR